MFTTGRFRVVVNGEVTLGNNRASIRYCIKSDYRFVMSLTSTTKRAAQLRKQKIVPIFQEGGLFLVVESSSIWDILWSWRYVMVYDMQELYYIINHISHFCHCCFSLFPSLCAFDLSALMLRSQMVG